jgi:uncharacterized protein DUF1854
VIVAVRSAGRIGFRALMLNPDEHGWNVNSEFFDLNVIQDQWGQLVLTLKDGTVHRGVDPIRCFPLTDPDRSIALVDLDGRELVNLPSLDVLNPTAREAIHRELVEREFAPVIWRITATSVPNPPCQWTVETDRGSTSFQLESEDDIRKLGQGAVIADSNGVRYKIQDISALDVHSQRIIRRLI